MLLKTLRYPVSCILLLALALAPGCSKLVEVGGVVTFEGKPLERGSITFMPETHGSPPAAGPIMSGGKWNMTTRNKEGAMSGTYKVVISSTDKNGREILPPSYSNTRETVLTFEVPEDGSNEIRFDLKKDGSAP